jgi:TonB-linked SusC/RagA family outer membrane protein
VTQSNFLGTNQFDWIPTHWTPSTDAATNTSTFRKLYYQLQLNYARKFGKNDVTVMGLFSRENYTTGNDYPYLREDWVGRATYNYASKYFAEVNGAYNGSEKFSDANRFAFFPSLALGWMVTEEKFMKELKFIDMLKIRASWGEVGSDNISGYSRWLYMTQWGYGGVGPAALSTTGGTSPYGEYYVKAIGNENIQWEMVTKKNIGADYAFFGGLLSGSVDFFNDYRQDILLTGTSQAIPSYYGATAPVQNLGKVKDQGYELSLHINKKLTKDIRVWADLSMTHAVNQIIDADDAQLLDDYQKQAGKSLGQNYSYVTKGYYNNWDQVYGSTKLNTNDAEKLPGNLNIIDYNGDGVIDNKDKVPAGYSEIPQNTYNTTIGFEWKNLSMSVQFYGVNNCSRYVELGSFGQNLDNVYHQGTYWTKSNMTADSPLPRWDSHMDFYSGSTLYLYDGSYLRLKTAEIAYTFRDRWVKEAGINSFRIYVNGDNLVLWSKLPDDREVNMGNSTAYPTVRRINFGINVTF